MFEWRSNIESKLQFFDVQEFFRPIEYTDKTLFLIGLVFGKSRP